jgi:hypothetical protein
VLPYTNVKRYEDEKIHTHIYIYIHGLGTLNKYKSNFNGYRRQKRVEREFYMYAKRENTSCGYLEENTSIGHIIHIVL